LSEPIPLRQQGGLLAFDLARSAGWCYAPPDFVSPAFIAPDPNYSKLVSGTEVLGRAGDEHGPIFLAAHHFFIRMIALYRPRFIALERPIILPGRFRGIGCGVGIAAILKMHGAHHRIQITDASPQEIKKFWTGNGRAEKDQMINFARQRGLAPKTDDEADAVALADHQCATLAITGLWPPRERANVA
jgi:hypothetical protein